jgi:aspartate/methionine/tyrosine aminotransferase
MDFSKFISRNLTNIVPSASMDISEKVKNLRIMGSDIIDLTIGEPDFNTPSHIKEAALKALAENKTHYTNGQGIIELRRAIANKLKKDNKIGVDPEAEILVAPGAKQAIFYSLLAVLNPGDEVLIPEPYWLSYPDILKLAQGVPVGMPSREEDCFKIGIKELKRAVSCRTKALILNSPNNPTGIIWNKEDLQQIASFVYEHDLMVISDEIYEKIIFDDKDFISIASLPYMHERVITINGFSKSYAMTGWRIAYLAGPEKIVTQIVKVNQHIATCSSSLSQYAALEALKGPQEELNAMVKEYKERRSILIKESAQLNKMSFFTPQGTFYAFLNIKKLGVSSLEAASLFLDKAGIATIPGSAYGPSGEGYLRICFTVSKKHILEAIGRLREKFS